jgi:hypothetical protein
MGRGGGGVRKRRRGAVGSWAGSTIVPSPQSPPPPTPGTPLATPPLAVSTPCAFPNWKPLPSPIIPALVALQIDGEGFLYVADTGNHCIRKITPDGMVVTLAGCGKVGYCDGFGTLARFCSPCSVCVDSATGVLYTSEHGCNVIRSVVQVSLVNGACAGFDVLPPCHHGSACIQALGWCTLYALGRSRSPSLCGQRHPGRPGVGPPSRMEGGPRWTLVPGTCLW